MLQYHSHHHRLHLIKIDPLSYPSHLYRHLDNVLTPNHKHLHSAQTVITTHQQERFFEKLQTMTKNKNKNKAYECYQLVNKHDIEGLSQFLLHHQGINLDHPGAGVTWDGGNALTLASENGYLVMIQMLLDFGCNIDYVTTTRQCTPLMYAVYSQKWQAALLLIHAHANIEQKDQAGDTVLAYAVRQSKNTQIFNMLLKKGANIHSKNNEGFSIFMEAARCSNIPALKKLAKLGVDIHVTNFNHYNACTLATMTGTCQTLEYLISLGVNPHQLTSTQENNLHIAVVYQQLDCAKKLIQSKVDLEQVDADGYTPLALAIIHGLEDFTELFLQSGASLDGLIYTMSFYEYAKKNEPHLCPLILKETSMREAKLLNQTLSNTDPHLKTITSHLRL